MHICTIIAKNYVAFARVLARSFAEQHPDGRTSVLVIDSIDGHIDPAAEPFDVLTPADIDCPAFEAMAVIYDVLELSTAVKPWLLRHLLTQSGPEGVVYLDPDIRILAPLTELETLTRAHGLVLTPHLITALPRDGLRPNEPFLLSAGTYNLGFTSISPRPASERLLDWWCERLRHDCLVDPARGYFVDQRWFDLLPSIVESFHVLRDPGYNVAYWNLHGRRVEPTEDGYLAGDRPLRFFHFSGFDPDRPDVLSLHQDRVDLRREPVIAELCRSYAHELHDSGFDESRRWTYDYATLPDGTRLTPRLRRLFRTIELDGGRPLASFTPAGLRTFYDHLNEPASPEGPPQVTRMLEAVYRDRPDLQAAFPDIAGDDRAAFLRWTRENGRDELSLPDALLPASPSSGRPAGRTGEQRRAKGTGLDPWGVNVAGYLRSELGVGEAARMAITALQAAGVPVLPVHGAFVPRSRQAHDYAASDTDSARFPVNLVCVNADMLPSFVEEAGSTFFADRHTIGMWFWEVSEFPERWHGSFGYLDELWVASSHVADALSPVSPIPVIKTRLPVTLPDFPPLGREALGLPDGFVFLKMFDFDSVFARKNPLGTVHAFRRAFPTPGTASLVLKSINSEHHPSELETLLAAAAEHPDIHVVDRYVSVAEKNAMIASCDCFVSLHRAEGFGIGPAEAMWLGKPVIATAYGGTLDFMTGANSFLVDKAIVEIGPSNDPYPARSVWAEPDEEHAASLMRLVVEDGGERRRRAERAAHDIRRTHSPEAVGAVMQRRLQHIRAVMAERAVEPEPPTDDLWSTIRILATGHAWQAIQTKSGEPASAQGGRLAPLRGLLRKQVLRMMRPFTVHQRDVDSVILDAIIALRAASKRSSAEATDAKLQLDRQSVELDRQSVELDRQSVERERQSVELSHLRESISAIEPIAQEAERLVSEMRARPYMNDPRFEVFTAGAQGKVYGYRAEPGPIGREQSYRAFEEIFRGPEDLISERQRVYLDQIADHAPVLDAGCGRGEFLDILRETGVEAIGVDMDAGMVEHCRSKGHAAEQGNVNVYLERVEEGTLGAIFCAQVIEHMPASDLEHFLRLAQSRLRSDGLLIFETVNPHSVPALKAFWVDLSHQHPVFPEVALQLVRAAGFGSAYVFHPNGKGDVEADRFEQGEYAVVARR